MAAGPLRIGILGAGAIGQTIARAIDDGKLEITLVALADQDHAIAEKLARSLKAAPPVVGLPRLVELSDLVVEAASQAAVPEILPLCLERRKDVLVMSVGALLGRDEWFLQARKQKTHIYVPSGAIAGLDGVKAASYGTVRSAMLSSRKPLAALRDAKFVVDKGIQLDSLKEDTIVLEGPAVDVCRAFPATSNVAAALQFALGASARLQVTILASPTAKRNVHEIVIESDSGTLRVTAENLPMESNPRTSKVAALSALAFLDQLTNSFRIGT
jgi:aspartate dehydrogenase